MECIAPVAVAQVDKDHAGAASGLIKTAQRLGAALGIAMAGSVYFAWHDSAAIPPSSAAVIVVASLLALCVVLAARLPDRIFAPAAINS
ncbi:hypothetical protein [Novosphingobium sp.]|uniref:hypothetical protein n=1 Tax=Novosphingobium sp. TaxID=1874826 RepID=UPI0035AFC9BA